MTGGFGGEVRTDAKGGKWGEWRGRGCIKREILSYKTHVLNPRRFFYL